MMNAGLTNEYGPASGSGGYSMPGVQPQQNFNGPSMMQPG